jgi:hypothetical protein
MSPNWSHCASIMADRQSEHGITFWQHLIRQQGLHGQVWFITVHIARLCSGCHGLNGELPQELEIVKHLARPQHNAAQWVIGNRDRKSCFFSDAPIQVLQQRATAGEHGCGSSEPHVSWQELASAWCVSLLARYSARCCSNRQVRLAAKASPAVLNWDRESCSDRQRCRSLCRDGITMVQSTESREGVDRAISPISDRYWPTGWRILRESEVRPIFMVIANIFGHQPLEVLLIQHDHVVQQVSSATPDPALCDAVLPRTAKGSAGWLPKSFTAEITSIPNFES